MYTSTSCTRLLRQFIHHIGHNNSCRPHYRLLHQFVQYPRTVSNPTTLIHHRLPRNSLRTFSSSNVVRASLASHPPGQPTELVYYPTPSSLPPPEDPDDPDVDLVEPEEARIEMTERAAEVRTTAARVRVRELDLCSLCSNYVPLPNDKEIPMRRCE